MNGSSGVLAVRGPVAPGRPRLQAWRGHLHGSDLTCSILFVIPYAALFVAFVIYPIAYALWMGSNPALYAELLSDPRYARAVVNTVHVAYPQGLPNNLLEALFGIEGPFWFDQKWLALSCDIAANTWKWMPLWTVVLLGGRMSIPQDLYDAADVDGASSYQRFAYITVPLLANLYLISTLVSTIWTFGDYAPVLFVSGGSPAFGSEVVSTLGFHYALDYANPPLGVAAGLSILPLLIPAVILLMRHLKRTEVQL
jgi:multiple sugar transport system permease protein